MANTGERRQGSYGQTNVSDDKARCKPDVSRWGERGKVGSCLSGTGNAAADIPQPGIPREFPLGNDGTLVSAIRVASVSSHGRKWRATLDQEPASKRAEEPSPQHNRAPDDELHLFLSGPCFGEQTLTTHNGALTAVRHRNRFAGIGCPAVWRPLESGWKSSNPCVEVPLGASAVMGAGNGPIRGSAAGEHWGTAW